MKHVVYCCCCCCYQVFEVSGDVLQPQLAHNQHETCLLLLLLPGVCGRR
jgi:hypothetical protein